MNKLTKLILPLVLSLSAASAMAATHVYVGGPRFGFGLNVPGPYYSQQHVYYGPHYAVEPYYVSDNFAVIADRAFNGGLQTEVVGQFTTYRQAERFAAQLGPGYVNIHISPNP